MSTDESEIAERLRNDDQSALEMVLKEIVPKLWPLIAKNFRESLSNEDIEDVIATALSKLWQGRSRFDSSKGDLEGWFYVILRNCALDRLRKNSPKIEEYLVVEPLPRTQASDQQKEALVRDAIATLNEREQLAVLPLFERSGVSVADLSEQLSVSTGAIRQLRFRALRKLNSILDQHGYTTRRIRTRSLRGGNKKQEQYHE